MPLDYTALTAPFPPEEIDWRVGSTTKDKTKGMALAYIDARVVMDRLDQVVGPDAWQCRYSGVGDNKTCCEIGIWMPPFNEWPGGWIWKGDGAGDTDFEGAKGAFSDAFKRSAVKWGIGRYLYDLQSPWVAIEPFGNKAKPSYRIAKHEIPRLMACLPNTPGTAEPPAKDQGKQGNVELKANLKAFAEELETVKTAKELEDLLTTFHDTIEEAKVDMPSWWETGDGLPEQFIPLKDRISTVEERLAIQGEYSTQAAE